MRLSIVLFFRAPLGGLQENVLATAVEAKTYGWEVSVFCAAGRFIDEYLQPAGIVTQAVDFESPFSIQAARDILTLSDIIHAHPGPSRILALDAASISGAPVIFTIHGAWFDNIQQYASRVASIICVSSAVQEAVYRLCPNHPSIHCIPNGIDFDRFGISGGDSKQPKHVVVASRLDTDKRVLIDTLIRLWEAQAKADTQTLHYTIAGQGSLQGELESAAQRFNIPVQFAGWLSADALRNLYEKASAVIASGRGAMEALAVGKPTLALASAGVAEVFYPSQLVQAAYSNFGGFGAKPPTSYEALFDGISLAASVSNAEFSQKAKSFIHENHDNKIVNKRIIDLYSCALESHKK